MRPVLAGKDGLHLNINQVRHCLEFVAKAAKVKHGVHVLRHTFCSRLAACGATTKEIQELAGHKNLTTTERYMHLAAGGRERAIALLNSPRNLEQ